MNTMIPGKNRTCRLANLTKEKHRSLIANNLDYLEKMLLYNQKNRIRLFRISSDLIPFGSEEDLGCDWRRDFKDRFQDIERLISNAEIRCTMHPGQYTVLNSPRQEVVERSIQELQYHTDVLTLLGTDESSKLILHLGGVYGERERAMERFVDTVSSLPKEIRGRLAIENDEKNYSIQEVLWISSQTGLPVVMDVHHHRIHPPEEMASEKEWLKRSVQTWKPKDGTAKIHYSQQAEHKRIGAHSDAIDLHVFQKDLAIFLEEQPLDIMLEVKDKNRSCLRVLTLLETGSRRLEEEWSRHKYDVMEHGYANYRNIQQRFSSGSIDPISFYDDIYQIKEIEPDTAAIKNTFEHVWGYLKKQASEKEKALYAQSIASFPKRMDDRQRIKRWLYQLAVKYGVTYLLESYYFEDQIQ